MMQTITRFCFVLLALIWLAPDQIASSAAAGGKESRPPGTKGGPMLLVPAGEFWMGCNAQVDTKCSDHEKPYHQVYLDAFYIDKFEVTQAEYDECVRAGKCQDNKKYNGFTGARQPVVGVKWEQAKNYCAWAGKRLPTEAQWEKAARGQDGRIYPWGNEFDAKKFNFCDKNCKESYADKDWDDGYAQTAPVGSYPQGASPYGALEMAGNVDEWVADWHADDYYSNTPAKNPPGPTSGKLRVLRGGSWADWAKFGRASNRSLCEPTSERYYIGVRCAKD